MTAAEAPCAVTFVVLSAKLIVPRCTRATHLPLAGRLMQLVVASPRPQSTIGPVSPLVWLANSIPNARYSLVAVTEASEPVPIGTDERTITPGAEMSIPLPVFEKLAC